jgi:phenylacetate-CoA ligase
VAATSGTTGHRGIFLWDLDEWVTVLGSYNPSLDWADATAGLTRRLRMAVVSSTTPWHQSARVGATVRSPWVQTLRIDSGDPLEGIIERLHRFQPQVLVGYASMLRLLASEQLAGRLPSLPRWSSAPPRSGRVRPDVGSNRRGAGDPLTSTRPPRRPASPPNARSRGACTCSRT